jgi:N-sulfoglucosamine sulfohydrolase
VSADRPNVLFITCHDLGRWLGCYDHPTVRSPHLDRLASEGVRFSQAYCTAPQCSPARASLFTGRYPHDNGVMGLTHSDFAWDLHPDEQHLGQVLHAAGYATALVGTHHESRTGPPEAVAARCGMDEVLPARTGSDVADRALAYLDRRDARQPFYLQVGFAEPHRARSTTHGESGYMGFLGDHVAPDDASGVEVPGYLADTPGARTEVAELQGAIHYVDAQIGRLLDGLAGRRLAESTLVVFTTDHGVALPRAKCALYDPGLETALIVRYPARGWVGGRVCDELVSGVDVYPTVLDAAGVPAPDRVQGRSLAPFLDGGSYQPRDEVFGELTYHEYYDPRRAIRTRTHRLIANFSSAPAFMDCSQSWRPRSDTRVPADPKTAYHPPVELYDLVADPWEAVDLATSEAHAGLRRDLLKRLLSWMRETDDPLLDGAVPSPMHRRAMLELLEASIPEVNA